MYNDSLPLRKIIVLALLGIILVFFGVWLFSYLTTGKLTVTAVSSSDTVSIKPLSYSPKGTNTKSAVHSLSVRIRPGKYIISVNNQTLGASKIVVVKARQSAKYTLSPVKYSSVEPVLAADAISLTADTTQLLYVDSVNGNLLRLDASNNVQVLDKTVIIKDADWVSPALGVLQDRNNKLYKVENGVIAPLEIPVTIPGSANSSFSLSKSGLLVFTNGKDIYAGQLGQKYIKIYSSADLRARVSVGGKNIAIIEALQESSKGEPDATRVVVIDSSGKRVQRDIKDAVRIVWSPSGKYLYVAGEIGDFMYDNSLNLVQTLDSETLGVVGWVDNSRLAYSKGASLWLYDVNSGQAQEIGQVTGDGIKLISVTADGSYIYMVSDSSLDGGGGKISRIGLQGQRVPSYVETLDIFLPENVGVCGLSYVNFTRPVITIHYPADTTTPDFCVNAAKGELQYYDLDPNKFSFSPSPYPAGE